ncbi:MAG: hypothetical protein JSV84_09280 [Gemmatimonadota bacterium]|nr:MAG: hypothetical protein JSV84_09280 [Gemmatimonadota bacterium]
MAAKLHPSPWIRYFASILLLILVGLGGFYFIIVQERKDLQSQYLLRVLSTAGQNVGETITGLRGNVKKAAETKKETDKTLQKTIEGKLALIPNLIKYPQSDFATWSEWITLKDPDSLENPKVDITINYENGEYVVTFTVKACTLKTEKKSFSDTREKFKDVFLTHARLRDLILPSLPDDVFDGGVVVARRNEMVLLQKGGAAAHLVQLPRAKVTEEEASSGVTDSCVTTQIRDVEIAGVKYKLFLQPFCIPVDVRWVDSTQDTTRHAPEKVWFMGGLIPNATFRAKTMAVSPTFVLFVVFLLVLGLLCLPFLRIRFIGLREGLRAHDVLVLAVALMVGCSLVTFAVIHLFTALTERETRARHLTIIARRIDCLVSSELDSLHLELIELTNTANTLRRQGTRPNILVEEKVRNPHFEMVWGMDKNGWQTWKWSVKSTTTPVSSFPEREYFRYARDYDLNLFSPLHHTGRNVLDDTTKDVKFLRGRYIQSIRSKTTGEVYAILSLRMSSEDFTGSIVSVIESPMLSLIDPVMPPGYSFAVIDRKGDVQFHSDKDRNLRENFFVELGSDEDVRAAVFSGTEKNVRFKYRAEPRSAVVTPLTHTPWTLVVFTDDRILSHLDLETMTLSLSLFGAYLILFLLFCLVLSLVSLAIASFRRRDRNDSGKIRSVGAIDRIARWCGRCDIAPGEARSMWFWPDGTKQKHYRILLWIMASFIALWCVGSQWRPAWMVWISPALSLILIVVVYVLIRWKNVSRGETDKAGERMTSLKVRWLYVVTIIGFLFNIAILPALSFYHLIHSEEVILYTKMHQLQLAESLRNRVDRHVARYRKIGLSDENEQCVRLRLALSDMRELSIQNAPDVYTLNSYVKESRNDSQSTPRRDKHQPSEERFKQVWIDRLSQAGLLPSYNEFAAVTRTLTSSQDGDHNRSWQFVSPDNLLRLNITDFRPSVPVGRIDKTRTIENTHQINLTIETPLDFQRSVNPYLILLALIFAVIVLLVIVWNVVRIVFVANVRYPRSLDGECFIKGADDSLRKLILRIRFPRKDSPSSISQFPFEIGIQDIRDAESAQDILSRVRNSQIQEIVLTNFDYDLDDPHIAHKKLELLEGLATFKEKRIVIESSIDPLYLFTARAHDFWVDKEKQHISLDRWSMVLQKFTKLRWRATEGEFDALRNKFNKELEQLENFKNMSSEVRSALVSEGWPNRILRDYAETLVSCKELQGYTAHDVVDQFLDLATAHYRRIWATCSTDEKVLLYRLAQEGFVNWRMRNTLRSLIRRRIVVAAPNFRLMNESFRRFVFRAERPEIFQEWEKAVESSMWSRIKKPLIFSGIALAVFFFATQREVFNRSLGMLAAVMTGAPVLIKIIGMLLQNRQVTSTHD